jgi:predicted TIM-barrel fold metal-dependent hydrolase
MITDSQVHIWTVDPSAAKPAEPQDHQLKHPNGFPAEELIAEMDAIGVDRAVICTAGSFMHGDATAYSNDAAQRYPSRLAVMDTFGWTESDARERFERSRADPHVLGFRTMVRAIMNSLDNETVRWIFDQCEAEGIPVTVLASGMPGKIAPVLERHPNLRLTFDHMGRVPDAKGEAAFAALDELLEFAKYPNVGVKVSSVPDSSAEPYPFQDLDAGLKRIYDAFGPRRMLWGSDLSGLSVSYRQCLDHFLIALDFLSAEEREWILGKSLANMYRWPES